MEWRQVIGFYQVVKLKSFTRAADVTFRTQSAISQQIKALEDELGCQLLERIGRNNLKLTPAGERFLKFSVTLLDSYDHLNVELQELQGQKTGCLRIAAPFETLYYLIRNNLKRFTVKYPNVELSILYCSPKDVVQLVKYGEIDFGITMEYVISPDLTGIRWKRSEKYLMTPPDHPLTKMRKVTIRQIVQHPLILPTKDYPIRKRFDEKLEQFNLKCHIAIKLPNVLLCADCVELGLGISFVAAGLYKQLLKEKRKIVFIPLKRQSEPDYFSIVTRKDKKLSAYQQEFINIFLGETIL